MNKPFPAYKGDDPFLFVSYSHIDSPAIYEELIWLEQQGFNVWYDEGIEAGTEWREELAIAIEKASLILYFVTDNSVKSENCRKEISYALDQSVSIISIYLEATNLPSGLKMSLSNIQAVLKYDIPEDSYKEKLKARIEAYLGSPEKDISSLSELSKPENEGRQLAAIMFTDICGYTSIMAEDEERALEVVVQNRELQQAALKKHQGTWLKEMGDGTLSSFPSTIDAVNCAIEIQERLRKIPGYDLRIGIHLGDVVFANGDVYGDGVNVAARIEPTAIPGGISISGQLHDTLTSRKDINALYLGEKELKHVKQPVKIYAITNSGLPTPQVFVNSTTQTPPDTAAKGNTTSELVSQKINKEEVSDNLILSWQNINRNTVRKLAFLIPILILGALGFQFSDRFLSDEANPISQSAAPGLAPANITVTRASIILDQALPRIRGFGLRTLFELAPDGSALAYLDATNNSVLLRSLASQETQVLWDTGPVIPLISPNSQRLLLASPLSGDVSIMPIQGGLPQQLPMTINPTLSEADSFVSWLSDEEIIYRRVDGSLRIFSLTDNSDEALPEIDAIANIGVVRQLPGGNAFLFALNALARQANEKQIQTYNLDTQNTTTVTSDGYSPQYVPSGHVIFLRAGDLWAVPFDADTLEVVGLERRVLEGVDSQPDLGRGAYSISDAGRLVYLPGPEYVDNQTILMWTDREGNQTELPITAGKYTSPSISPDGQFLALTAWQADDTTDIVIYDFSRETLDRRTFTGHARNPVWTPDGSQVVYQLTQENSMAPTVYQNPRGSLWLVNADGTGQAEQILDASATPSSFSAVDRRLFYRTGWAEELVQGTLTFRDDEWVSEPLPDTEISTWGSQVSPDGNWIAYTSAESGTEQVYVRPYPVLSDGKWQITSEEISSLEPTWGPDSDELFFLRFDGTLMHTEIEFGQGFSPSTPRPLVNDVEFDIYNSPGYIVSREGDRFLHFVNKNEQSEERVAQSYTALAVVENWFEEVNQLAPANRP